MLPDCEAGVWHTLQRRWRQAARRWQRLTLAGLVRAYCAVFKGRPVGRKRWVRGLLADRAPDGWPARASWKRRGPRWLAIYERAGAFLRGEIPDLCKGEPTHTGGLIDSARMNPHKFRMVWCGRTGDQRFWEVR